MRELVTEVKLNVFFEGILVVDNSAPLPCVFAIFLFDGVELNRWSNALIFLVWISWVATITIEGGLEDVRTILALLVTVVKVFFELKTIEVEMVVETLVINVESLLSLTSIELDGSFTRDE